MFRDLVITLALVVVIVSGLWLAGVGRETMAGLVGYLTSSSDEPAPGEVSADDAMAMLADGAVWCFWPDERRRCAWAIRAEGAPTAAGFDVSVYAVERIANDVAEISVARTGLKVENGRLCDDPARPTTRSRLGYYADRDGVVLQDPRLRPASVAEFTAFRDAVGDPREAASCFRFEAGGETAAGKIWRQVFLKDGAEDGEPETFAVFPADTTVRLAPAW